jgi:hypothetical protein
MSFPTLNLKMKLPEIISKAKRDTPTENQSDSSYTYGRRPATAQVYETKPSYIARKVENEELYGDPKASSLLSQINEEATAEWEDGTPKANIFDQKQEPINIFRAEMLNSQKYKEHNKGPIYRDGQLVKHSIVGPVEAFEKYERRMKKQTNKDSMMSIDKDSNSEASSSVQNKNVRPLSTRSNDPTSQSFLTGFASNQGVVSRRPGADKKKERNEIKVSREELLNQIDKMKESQDKFYDLQMEKLKTLSKGDRLHLTKEQRCLDKHEENLAIWDRIIERNNRKIGRDPAKSVSLRSEDFRSKKEMAQILDAIKTDQERYGTVYWYMTLRKKSPKAIRPDCVQYVPEAYNNAFLEEHNNSLEIITKPKQFSESAIEFGRITHFGRTGREYVQQKLSARDKALAKVKPSKIEDLKELIVRVSN